MSIEHYHQKRDFGKTPEPRGASKSKNKAKGFSYVIQFDDEPARERDTVYEVDGVKFYVDKKSLVYLAGSLLDYEKTLMFQGFKFRNPNEATSCGCGHSFAVK